MDDTISLEEGWNTTKASIDRVITIIEDGMKESFPIADSSQAYTCAARPRPCSSHCPGLLPIQRRRRHSGLRRQQLLRCGLLTPGTIC